MNSNCVTNVLEGGQGEGPAVGWYFCFLITRWSFPTEPMVTKSPDLSAICPIDQGTRTLLCAQHHGERPSAREDGSPSGLCHLPR